MRRHSLLRGLLFGLLSTPPLLFGCTGGTGVARMGPHLPEKEEKPIRVAEPPPPVKVEAIPLRRNKNCVYRDGAWVNDGTGWQWDRGEWILPPLGCYYAPPQTAYEEFDVGTALVHRPGVWHPRRKSNARCPKPRECPAPVGK